MNNEFNNGMPNMDPNMNNPVNNGIPNMDPSMNNPVNNGMQNVNNNVNTPSKKGILEKIKCIPNIVKIIVTVVFVLVIILILGSVISKGKYDLICTNKEVNNNVVTEYEFKFKDIGKYVTSENSIRMYKKDKTKVKNYEELKEKIPTYGLGQKIALVDNGKTVLITYSSSHINYPDISDVKKDVKSSGMKCR